MWSCVKNKGVYDPEHHTVAAAAGPQTTEYTAVCAYEIWAIAFNFCNSY